MKISSEQSTNVHKRCRGAYAVVGLVANYGLFAFRDPNGIRPLCFGVRHTEEGDEYAVAFRVSGTGQSGI